MKMTAFSYESFQLTIYNVTDHIPENALPGPVCKYIWSGLQMQSLQISYNRFTPALVYRGFNPTALRTAKIPALVHTGALTPHCTLNSQNSIVLAILTAIGLKTSNFWLF